MFLLRRPSSADIERFLDASRGLPLSYAPAGILATGASRGRRDEVIERIGHGENDYFRARRALTTWAHFDIGWVKAFPEHARIATGTVVTVRIRHIGFWSLNGCRIIATSEADAVRFGFTYGTLPNHAEAGEERFEVFLEAATGEVKYSIRAISWPNAILARVGQPIVRGLQERFRRDSIAAMRRAVQNSR